MVCFYVAINWIYLGIVSMVLDSFRLVQFTEDTEAFDADEKLAVLQQFLDEDRYSFNIFL